MASVCEVCGKAPIFGKRLSHSHRRTNRRWNPNVQRVPAVVDGSPRQLHVCTSCIKSGKIQKPLDMQGVVRSFDPGNGEGVVTASDGTRAEFLLAAGATLEDSIFRMLRQGQRVDFDLDTKGLATQGAHRQRGRHGSSPPTSRCRTKLAGSGRRV